MRSLRKRQRVLALALVFALFASLVLAASSGLAVGDREMLFNGNFESGFATVPGCGAVGQGWGCFTNGGSIFYGFFDDQWAPVVADGSHSQLIELSTLQYAASEADRYAGIFQTVVLVPGATYQLQLQGLMREQNPNPAEDMFRYRVQWGYTTDGSTDWTTVNNWVELPWDKIDDRLNPTGLQSYSTSFVAPSSKVTLFFRVWKKWGTTYKELDVNLDAISLFGPAQPPKPPKPKPPKPVVIEPQPEQPAPMQPIPVAPAVSPAPTGAQQAGVCTGKNYIRNGDFESGFVQYPNAAVGLYWGFFNNAGQANYGYYDDQWPPVVQDGSHSQLVEINTYNVFPGGDQSRVSGIYQVVKGLKPGTTYELSMWGLMREALPANQGDAFRYRVQWGYAANAGSYVAINNWTDVPWNDIYDRLNPGPMLPFSVQFQAPSKTVVIGIRALNKWDIPNQELDVNLDAIQLRDCTPPPSPPPCMAPCQLPPPPCGTCGEPPKPADPPATTCTWYTVQPGDTLGAVAARSGTTIRSLMQANNIVNANVIVVGQKLCLR